MTQKRGPLEGSKKGPKRGLNPRLVGIQSEITLQYVPEACRSALQNCVNTYYGPVYQKKGVFGIPGGGPKRGQKRVQKRVKK